jgi:hypothetical protein
MAYVPIMKWSIDRIEELGATLQGDAGLQEGAASPAKGFDV